MAVVRKKQDDKILKTLREMVTVGNNKECFDCGQKGPTYVNMTIGSFVCTQCSGLLRGLTPPHRVKSISMATFTSDDIKFLSQNGNDNCAKTWLGLWDTKRSIKQDHRDFMVDKYEKKRYFLEPASPLKSLPTSTTASSLASRNGLSSSSTTSLSSTDNNFDASVSDASSQKLKPSSLSLNTSVNNSNVALPLNGISRHKFQQQFTPDEVNSNNLFNGNLSNSSTPKILPPIQNHKSHADRIVAANGHTKNGHLKNCFNNINNNSNNNNNNNNNNVIDANKFTPDTEFVADFSKASTMFNQMTNANSCNSKLSNGHDGKQSAVITNGKNGVVTREVNENFADFEHNPIYNAAEEQMNNINANINKLIMNSSNNNNNISNQNTANNNHNCTNNNNNNPLQWNLWQQFQWSSVDHNINHAPPVKNSNSKNQNQKSQNQNRWSLPMSLSSTGNSLNSSANSTSSISSNPPIDRYAALKDLDEQFREIKMEKEMEKQQTEVVTVTNGHSTVSSAQTINPFKTANPFNWASTPPTTTDHNSNGFYGSSPYQNGFGASHTNYQNGFSSQFATAPTNNFNHHNLFRNPFMATGAPLGTTGNSNNPFL